jgi:hypothetical protein
MMSKMDSQDTVLLIGSFNFLEPVRARASSRRTVRSTVIRTVRVRPAQLAWENGSIIVSPNPQNGHRHLLQVRHRKTQRSHIVNEKTPLARKKDPSNCGLTLVLQAEMRMKLGLKRLSGSSIGSSSNSKQVHQQQALTTGGFREDALLAISSTVIDSSSSASSSTSASSSVEVFAPSHHHNNNNHHAAAASLSRRLGFRRSFSNSSRTAATTLLLCGGGQLQEGNTHNNNKKTGAPRAAIISPTTEDDCGSQRTFDDDEEDENDDDKGVASSSLHATNNSSSTVIMEKPGARNQDRSSPVREWNRTNAPAAANANAANSRDERDGKRQSDNHKSTAAVDPATCLIPAKNASGSLSVPEAVEQWLVAASGLAESREFHKLMWCSAEVVRAATVASVSVALLPVTIPIRVARGVSNAFVGSCVDAVQVAAAMLLPVVAPGLLGNGKHPKRLMAPPMPDSEQENPQRERESSCESPLSLSSSRQQVEEAEAGGNLISGVLGVPWMLLGAAGKVKEDVVGSLLSLAPSPSSNCSQGVRWRHDQRDQPSTPENKGKLLVVDDRDSCERERFLNRLRLDYGSSLLGEEASGDSDDASSCNNSVPFVAASSSVAKTSAQQPAMVVEQPRQQVLPPTSSPCEDASSYSKYLLPVLDVGLHHDGRIVHFVDLQDFQAGDLSSSSAAVAKALDLLVGFGLGLLSNHPTVRLSSQSHLSSPPPKKASARAGGGIEWRPEGSTSKTLRRMVPLSSLDRLKALEQEVLIWSGTLPSSPRYPFFLARGVVARRPLDFMRLLWDNERTSEYNNFCLGRTNLLILQDQVLASSTCADEIKKDTMTGTKVVLSETRVPFTSLSVLVSCCMHVRPLDGADEGGYVIVSRSLYTGSAGTRYSPDGVEPTTKNEILWGINVIRRVPNHPHLTDLTSLSQVGSTLVPKFLATRIGLMGIEDFFKNVRKGCPAAGSDEQSPEIAHAQYRPPHRSASC